VQPVDSYCTDIQMTTHLHLVPKLRTRIPLTPLPRRKVGNSYPSALFDIGCNIILCKYLDYGRIVCDTEVEIEVSVKLQCCLCVFRVDLPWLWRPWKWRDSIAVLRNINIYFKCTQCHNPEDQNMNHSVMVAGDRRGIHQLLLWY
jgi:hypothetical protein